MIASWGTILVRIGGIQSLMISAKLVHLYSRRAKFKRLVSAVEGVPVAPFNMQTAASSKMIRCLRRMSRSREPHLLFALPLLSLKPFEKIDCNQIQFAGLQCA